MLVALTLLVVVGCGGGTDAATSTSRTTPVASKPADNVGSGALSSTRFAVPPIVTFLRDGKVGGYAVYARFNRDVPRRPDGRIRARFQVAGIDGYDQMFATAKRRHCFSGGIQFNIADAPHQVGERVEVVLNSLDANGNVTGTLATTARLIRKPKRSPRDYSPDPLPGKLGCGKLDRGL